MTPAGRNLVAFLVPITVGMGAGALVAVRLTTAEPRLASARAERRPISTARVETSSAEACQTLAQAPGELGAPDLLDFRLTFGRWLDSEPETALAFLSAQAARGARSELVREGLRALVARDPARAMEWLKTVDASDRVVHGFDALVHEATAEQGGAAVASRLLQDPATDKGLAFSVLTGLTLTDPRAALEMTTRFSAGDVADSHLRSRAAMAILSRDGAGPVLRELATAKASDQNLTLLRGALERRWSEDRDALFAGITSLQDPALQKAALSGALERVGKEISAENFGTFLHWAAEQVPDDLQLEAHRRLFFSLQRKDPDAAKAYLSALEDEAAAAPSLGAIVDDLRAKDRP